MTDSLFLLLKKFLQKENFHINFHELRLQLLSHPSYPSLHSITGVLDHFRIDNLALEVPTDRDTLMQLPKTFLSLNQNNQFIIVTKLRDDLEVIADENNKSTMSVPEFLDQWRGVVVAVEKDDAKFLEDRAGKGISKKIIYAALLLSVLGLFFFSNPTFFQSAHFILGLGGLAITVLIVKHELGFRSAAIEKFCSGNKATSCDDVLDSKGAMIFGRFKLSDICVVYFLGLGFTWLFFVQLQSNIAAIITISILVVPVTLYSIYYQAVVVKKWCPLCLGIVGILWLQCCSLLVLDTPISNMEFDPGGSFVLFFSFMLATALWTFANPLLAKERELEKLTIAHFKFIRNFELFKAVYDQNDFIETTIAELSSDEIVLGNLDSPLNIVVVTSPLCFYCKAAHTDLEKILHQHPDQVKITVRFNTGIKDKEEQAYRIVSRLIEIYNTVSARQCAEAMHEAYLSDADMDKWLLKWGAAKSSLYDPVLHAQQSWCHANGINFTPAVYVNGKQFPKEYERSDLSYFIEDLVEEAETSTNIELPTVIEMINE